jgi:uncharacterized membrane protein YfcA
VIPGSTTTALVTVVAGVAGFVTGLAGFGTGLVASGPWLLLLPAGAVPPLVATTSVAAQLASLRAIRSDVCLTALMPYVLGAMVGVPLGVQLLRYSSTFLRLTVGLFLVAFAGAEPTGALRGNIVRADGWMGATVVGAGGGCLAGFAGLSAPLLVVWLRPKGGSARSQRAIYQPYDLVVLVASVAAMSIGGQIDRSTVVMAGLCVPAALIGGRLGSRYYERVRHTTFRYLILAPLAVSGGVLLSSAESTSRIRWLGPIRSSMTGVLLFLVAATALALFGILHSRPSLFRRWAQGSFVAGLGLIAFTSYFAWREHQTVSELARLVDPIPEITEVTYVPTPAELQAVAGALAATPGTTRTGDTQADRRETARRIGTVQSRYWLLKTSLGPQDVVEFYAAPEHRSGWDIASQDESWIIMNGAAGRLIIFTTTDWPRPGTQVLYMYDGA